MPAFPVVVTPQSLRPGAIVSTWIFPFFRHRGVVSDRFHNGKPMVISNSASAGRITEEPWDTFAAGQAVVAESYPGILPPFQVLQRARSLMGKPYQLFTWNCDHAVTYAHGLKPSSPQLAVTLMLIAIGGLIVAKSG